VHRLAILTSFAAAACAADAAPAPAPQPPAAMPSPLIDQTPGLHLDVALAPLEALLTEAADTIERARVEMPGAVPPTFAEASRQLTSLFAVPDHGISPQRRAELGLEMPDPPRLAISRHGSCGSFAVPLGDGWLVRLALKHGDPGDGSQAGWERGAAFIRREAAGVRIHERAPRDLPATRVQSVTGQVWMSPARRWMSADVELTVVADAALATLHDFDAAMIGGSCGLASGYRLTQLSIEGTDRWDRSGDVLVFPVTPGKPTRLRLRFEGVPPTVDRDDRVARLAEWLPTSDSNAPTQLDLTVFHDEGTALGTGVAVEPAPAPAGWTGTRIRGELTLPEILVEAARELPVATTRARGVAVTIRGALAACPDKVAAVIERMPDLAPLPALHISEMQSTESTGGVHADGRIVIHADTAAAFCDAAATDDDGARMSYEPLAVLMHEVAHEWFGGAVLTRDDEVGAVWESLAEYTSWLAMPAGVADDRRKQANHRYQSIEEDDGIAQRVGRTWQHRRVLSYEKGPLALTAIEGHIGRDRMIEVLRHFIATYRGQHGSWRGVLASIEAVAGAEAAAWARPWIERGGAPDLRMVGARVRNGRFTATLTQVTTPPFVGEVEILVTDDEPRTLRFAIGTGAVAIDVPVRGLDYVILDPRHRMPRRYLQKPGPMNPEIWFNAPH
jgi:hypothetical protein